MKKPDYSKMIEDNNKAKSIKRREYSLNLMEKYKGLCDCKKCLHGITHSCTDNLPNGCEYFCDIKTGEMPLKHETYAYKHKYIHKKPHVCAGRV